MNKNCNFKIIVLLTAIIFSCYSFAQTVQPQLATYNQKLQSSVLLFMENRGQVTDEKGNLQPDILFTANSAGAKVYLTANSIHYQFTKTEYPEGYDPQKKGLGTDPLKDTGLQKQIKHSTHHFTLELQGANQHPTVSTEKQSIYFENYYLAQCPNGITGVHGYERITYKNVYPNIDWVIYSKGGFMEYDFLVHPGGDAQQIKLKVKDAESVSINKAGELVMKTSLGEVRQKAPVSYADGRLIASLFKQSGDGTIGFDVQPQPGKELRIDPSIAWSTYYGGSGEERGFSCAVDASHQVYLAGTTTSAAGIASGGFQTNFGGGTYADAFLAKFDNNGNRLWSTYYGGNDIDYGFFCAVDGNGDVYLTGVTYSTSAIASGGFQNVFGGTFDAFLTKFNSSGSRLWSTYYGGTEGDYSWLVAVDNNNNVYLTGFTTSTTGIASMGSFQPVNFGGNDAYVVKFNSSGNRMWGTYYGGTGNDLGYSCAVDGNNNVYIAGSTTVSTNMAAGGFMNTNAGQYDAFLVKFDTNGNRIWGTYYGGSSTDYGFNCATDNNDNVYLTGVTLSNTGIAFNGFQNNLNSASTSSSYDAFLVKFSSAGNRLWATYYGDNGNENSISCNADISGNVYLAGFTTSVTGIASGGFQNTFAGGYADAFLVKFSSSGNRLWATYYGGNGDESNYDDIPVITDNNGDIYMAGVTTSVSGIAVNGFQNTYGGGIDAFLVKITDETLCIAASTPTIYATPDTTCGNMLSTISITAGKLNSATQWQWRKDSCNGAMVGAGTSISVYPMVTTTYFVRGEGGCATPGNCVSKTIIVSTPPVVSFTATPATICSGDTIAVNFTGSAAPIANYLWNWGGGRVISGSNSGPYKVVYSASGTITLTVTSGRCSVTANPQNITVNQSPKATFAVSDSTGCNQLAVLFTNTSQNVTGWQWNFGDGASSGIAVPPVHQYTTGIYTASLTVTNGQCGNTSVPTIIRVVDGPVAMFSVLPGINTPVQLSQATFRFTNTSQNATRYVWRFTNGDSTTTKNPSYHFTSAGNYAVSLYAYNVGCADTLTMEPIIVVADSVLRIPNAFSPNNDGINDTWVIYGLQNISNCKVRIFNRWGQIVYNATGYNKPWDGNYNGKSLPVDSYYYIIEANSRNYTGSVILLR